MNRPRVALVLYRSMSPPNLPPSDPAGPVPVASPPSPEGERRALGITQRSMRYHRPRAPFCGIGYCTNCIARTSDHLTARACMEGFDPPRASSRSYGWPSTQFDIAGVLDVLFPRGIDTLHGFRRPSWAVPLYQRIVRHLSGYGRVPATPSATDPLPPPLSKTVDVVVVGAGVSGSAAIQALHARGVESVCGLDRGRTPRGDSNGVDLPNTTALFLPAPDLSAEHPFLLLASRADGRAVVLRSRRVVVATGAYDASLLFGGNDRPGVMTADGAFAFAAAHLEPFRRAVVFGDGPRAMSVVERFDERVAAVVSPGEVGPDLTRAASDRGIPLYPRSLLIRANGRRWVRSVTLRTRGQGASITLSADAVVLAHRRLPHPQLFFQAGAQMRWSSVSGAYYPRTDATGATSVPGLYAVGEARAPMPAEALAASGRRVAEAIALAEPPGDPAPDDASGSTPHPLEGYYRELLQNGRGLTKWIACPCEDILLDEVEKAHQHGFRGVEVIKRYTGLGTGLCQGRYCLPDALLVLSILEGRSPSEVGFITQRPPVVPTSLRTLASAAELLAPPGAP